MSSRDAGSVMTVTGPIAPEELGFTLPHEHVFIRLWELAGRYDFAGMLEDADILADELTAYAELGGRSIVELTVRGIDPRPAALRDMSERTGVQIVMGCGWYRQPYYPVEDLVDRRSVDDLAQVLVEEIETGFGDTGVRPGIIGEIGVDKSWVSAQEERVHRAAARAAVATGLAVTTHTVGSAVGLAQLDILTGEGLAPDRVIIGHADSYLDLAYYREVLARGAWLQFDNLGAFPARYTARVLDVIATLIAEGNLHRLLLSQDVCKRDMLAFMGGQGYTYLQREALPALAERGCDEEVLRRLCTDNPRAVLTRGTV